MRRREKDGSLIYGAERVQEALDTERGDDERGVGEYAASVAPPKQVPAPPPAPAAPAAPEPAPKAPEPPLRGASVSNQAAARETPPQVQTYDRGDGTKLIVDWSLGSSEPFNPAAMQAQLAAVREQNARLQRDLADLQRSLDSAELRALRKRIVHDMVELAPLAKAQAKAGKPALFRLLIRAAGIRSLK